MAKDCCHSKKGVPEKKRLIDPFLGAVIGITLVMLLGVVVWGVKLGAMAEVVVADSQVELAVETQTYDWGTIDINGGMATKTFEFENKGSSPLKLYGLKTSCACTTGQIIIGGQAYKKIGMHDNDTTIYELNPGEKAELSVEFDPLYHGPSGVGPVTRLVAMNTNDPEMPVLQFQLTGNVVKN